MKVRFEDRTRWAPMTWVSDKDSRPVPYLTIDHEMVRLVVRETTSLIHRVKGKPNA